MVVRPPLDLRVPARQLDELAERFRVQFWILDQLSSNALRHLHVVINTRVAHDDTRIALHIETRPPRSCGKQYTTQTPNTNSVARRPLHTRR